MKIIYLIILLFIGLILYLILSKLCKCDIKEGYGNFGRVHLEKCCPKGYKFSTGRNACIRLCDACDPSVYNKLTLKAEKYHGDSQQQLHAYFNCEEHDAKTIYDYDSINRLYTKDDLLDQDDYGGWNMNSDFFTAYVSGSDVADSTAAVQGSEEGGDETWGGITGEFTGSSATWEETSNEQGPFEEIPEEYYYTESDGCDSDYDNIENPPQEKPTNCIGHWRLDLSDERFDYIKDNDDRYAVPNWVINRTDTESSIIESNRNMVSNTMNERAGGPNTPVGSIYNNFLSTYGSQADILIGQNIQNTEGILQENRHNFCVKLEDKIDNGIFSSEEQTDPPETIEDIKARNIIDSISYNDICPSDIENINDYSEYINNDNWNTLCGSDMSELISPFDRTYDNNNEKTFLCDSQKENDNDKFLCPTADMQNIDNEISFCPSS